MEQELSRHGLRQEWLPIKHSFFVALAKQMTRQQLLPDSTDFKSFAADAQKQAESFLHDQRPGLAKDGIVPRSKLEGHMLAAACLHGVAVVHWAAAAEGLVETAYSPPHGAACRGRVYVCSVGPVLWSAAPLGPGERRAAGGGGGEEGPVSEARLSEEISQRLFRAQVLKWRTNDKINQ